MGIPRNVGYIQGRKAMPALRSNDGDESSQIRELCQSHIEALHNLHFLLEREVVPDSGAAILLRAFKGHLDCVTKALCLDK